MVVAQGDIYWADLPPPVGSKPGFRRPVVVVQSDSLNLSRINTVLCVPLTSKLHYAQARGNVLLPADRTGLPEDSVANVSQIFPVNRSDLLERTGHLGRRDLLQIFNGIDVILGRSD